ncbi:unnamed protein product [Microthlaspi erraticum]|uniref:ER membrane protein complex subunit 3 n=1 Tax=Microthlaspi erraticum TaxID=1685480 RepID=A0A6D2KKH3_9BRAS|nr:unnamed protein product [Microthlaspi erraticum]CAA7057415.1 unnamed protein product [Microthlaspi erraticum]
MAEDLVLDTAIRDWVLIPLSVVMVLIGILRYFVSKLMRSSPTPDAKMVKEGQVVIRARNLKSGANFIPTKSFRARRFYFSNEVCFPVTFLALVSLSFLFGKVCNFRGSNFNSEL